LQRSAEISFSVLKHSEEFFVPVSGLWNKIRWVETHDRAKARDLTFQFLDMLPELMHWLPVLVELFYL
jgi:hypothetical protein